MSAAILLAPPAAAIATFQGRNGEIAFVSGRGASGDASADVYIIDRPQRPRRRSADYGRRPASSPRLDGDARRLVYALFDGATSEDLWVHDTVNGGRTNVTLSGTVREDRPASSPDGTKVAYESEVSEGSGQMDILVTTLGPGGGTINLTSRPNAAEGKPVWSPDGKDIFYSRVVPANGADHDIMRERSNNSQAIPSFVVFSAAAEYQPPLSPDGSDLRYTRGPFGSNLADIFGIAASGSNPPGADISDNLTTDYGNPADPLAGDYNCVFSPHGRKIAYVKGTFSNGGLVYKNADDSGPVEGLVDNAAAVFDGNPDWARKPGKCLGKPATIYGSDGGEVIRGTPGDDVIVGFKGNDSVNGRGGRDAVCAGGGRDSVAGKGGNDKLLGGPGNDSLNGARASTRATAARVATAHRAASAGSGFRSGPGSSSGGRPATFPAWTSRRRSAPAARTRPSRRSRSIASCSTSCSSSPAGRRTTT